ncbi:large membrane protein, partial [Mycolicibacterium phlei RIVM601174]
KSINDGPERLRPLLPSLRSISVPKFGVNIPSTVDTSAFSTFIADAAKLSSFSLPETALNRLTGLSGIAAQHSKLFDSLEPLLDAQSGWSAPFDRINSDLFKPHAATQAQFDPPRRVGRVLPLGRMGTWDRSHRGGIQTS